MKSFGIDKIILAAYDYFALTLLYNFSTMVSQIFWLLLQGEFDANIKMQHQNANIEIQANHSAKIVQ